MGLVSSELNMLQGAEASRAGEGRCSQRGHVHVRVRIHVHVRVCACARIHVCMRVCVCVCVCVLAVCACAWVHVCTCVCLCGLQEGRVWADRLVMRRACVSGSAIRLSEASAEARRHHMHHRVRCRLMRCGHGPEGAEAAAKCLTRVRQALQPAHAPAE